MYKLLTDIVLADFSFRDKVITRNYLIDGLKYSEIAEKHSVSVSTVCRVILEGQKKLAGDFSKWLFRSVLAEKHIKEFFDEKRNVKV